MKLRRRLLAAAASITLVAASCAAAAGTVYTTTYDYTGNAFSPSTCGFYSGCTLSGQITASVTFNFASNYSGPAYPSQILSYTLSPNDGAGITFSSLHPVPTQVLNASTVFLFNNGAISNWFFDVYTGVATHVNGQETGTQGSTFACCKASAQDYDDLLSGDGGFGAITGKPGVWSLGGSTASPPPTLTELAEMSQESYQTSSIKPVDAFRSVQSVLGSGGFFAQVYQDGSQVVVAFRGSVFQGSEFNNLKSIAADKSFVFGQPTSVFQSDVSQATALLKELAAEPQFAGDSFTLTGHSLGGAIAQLEGNASGLPTTAFDAPGAGRLISPLSAELNFSGTTFNNAGPNVNIRLFGDQVSVVGQAIGSQKTLANNIFAEGHTIADPELTLVEDHSIETIADQLGAGVLPQPGVQGPTIDLDLALVAGVGDLLTFVVSPMEKVELDPPSSNVYELDGDPGSPYLNSLTLPFLPSVASYDAESDKDGTWSPAFSLAPGQSYAFGPDVTGVQFWGLNDAGQTLTLPSQFIFDVAFTNGGTFDGILTGFGGAGVPEPASWLLAVFGVGLVGSQMRSKAVRRVKLISASV